MVLMRFDSITAPGVQGLRVGSALVATSRTAVVSASWARAGPSTAVTSRAAAAKRTSDLPIPIVYPPVSRELCVVDSGPGEHGGDLLRHLLDEPRESLQRRVVHAERRSPDADAPHNGPFTPEDRRANALGVRVEVFVGYRVAPAPDEVELCPQAPRVPDALVGVGRLLGQVGDHGFPLVCR